jgi:hypothetical protein
VRPAVCHFPASDFADFWLVARLLAFDTQRHEGCIFLAAISIPINETNLSSSP